MIRLSAFADEISPEPVEQLDVLQSYGIRHVELRSVRRINVMEMTEDQHAEFRVLLLNRGMGLSAIGSPIGKIPITDPFEPHLERFARALDLADYYETPRIRVFSFYIPAGTEAASHREEVMSRMSTLASLAAGRGVSLFLENEKGIYGDTAARVLDVLATVNSPALGHAFDPANYLEIGESIDVAWDLLRSRTIHIHVKDYDVETGKNVVAGQGQGQIARLISDAVETGYRGFCTLEPHLLVAEAAFGFTGPERFGDAARALQSELNAKDRLRVSHRVIPSAFSRLDGKWTRSDWDRV